MGGLVRDDGGTGADQRGERVPLPLAGTKVLEVGSWIAAPAAARILKDWGAEILKVEPLTGDPLRGMSNPARVSGVNPPFELTNAGKRSVAIDLRSERGTEIFHELARRSDVLVTNLQPAAAARLGIDYEHVRQVAPQIIYCAVSGYGMDGDIAERPAFDGAAYWAASGMASMISEGFDEPVFPRAAVGDHSTAMSAVAGICAALLARNATGQGQFVHTSLVGNAAFQLSWDYANLEWVEQMAPTPDRASPSNPLNSYYRCADGKWIALVALQSDLHWPSVCEVVGRPDLLEDERFGSARSRAVNAEALVAELDGAFAKLESGEVARELDRRGVVWAPVNDARDAMADPVLAPVLWSECEVGGVPRRVIRVPVDFGGVNASLGGEVPEVGQHTEEVLLELGLDWDAIAAAKENRAII